MQKPAGNSDHEVLEQLVHRIQAGDPAADSELVARYQPGLRYHLQNMTGNGDLTQDLLQDTLGLALKKIRNGELKQPRALNQFIFNLAKNLYIAHYRKKKRRGDVGFDPQQQDVVDPGEDPQQRLERLQEINMVRRMVEGLKSKRDRLVLKHFYIEQKDKETVCRELKIDMNIFNTVLCRARARFRELWEKQGRQKHD